jgi:DNA polymerase (family 10)
MRIGTESFTLRFRRNFMENQEFAKIFYEMADLLELGEENPFRIRAYQKAAHNIESFSENVESLYKKGGIKALEDVPGIGKGIAEHIEEIIKTGKLKSHEDLLKKFPKSMLELVAVPGIGPKTAVLLYKKMKIDSIAKLEKAAKEGKLAKLPGIRTKKIQNILSGIELQKKSAGRFSIGTALPYAEAIIASLKKLKEVDGIVPCGSLRRAKETIGDIDILITSEKPAKVMDAFAGLSQVEKVIAKGGTKTSVLLKNGMQADLRVVEPESFGAAVYYFTGSKQHNIQLREMAVKKGLKINEYGIYRGSKRIGGAEEKDVFKILGLSYIPPEIREAQGEIEAAKKGKIPALLELKDIRGDLHMHTKATDGSNTIEEMAAAAKKMGYEYIAITDHTKSTRIAGGLTEKEALAHMKKIDQANGRAGGIRIIRGMEVDILPDGKLDYADGILKEIDIVFASVHSNFKMPKREMTKRIISAMKNKYVTVLSHPTGRLIGERDPYEVDLNEVLKAAKDTGTFIELNANPMRLDLDDIHCRKAKEMGIPIVITTDAHSATQLELMRYGVLTARRGWLEKKDVLNTLPREKLVKTLALKRA